jgi:diguanylate cyclase (GGDEF)-like protein
MSPWMRVALTACTALGVVVAHVVVGPSVGGVAVFGALVVVAIIGATWGAAAGLVLGVAFGAGIDGDGMLRTGIPSGGFMDLLRGGAVVSPLVFGALGFTIGRLVRLHQQVRSLRHASVRAQYDALTGLYNRQAFERRLEEWTADTGGASGIFALLFVDLDRFKYVNDTFGHGVGDKLLRLVAKALRDGVRDGDLVARLGGDEFVLALRGLRDRDAAAAVAEKLVRRLASPFVVDGRALTVSASIGIALYPRDGEDVATLTKSADAAMYIVKARGKNSYGFSSVEMRTQQSRRLEIERGLRSAQENDELELFYQPQVDLVDGRLVGFEALIRWHSRELGLVSPTEFIPIAEEAGMIVPIGRWLLHEACSRARAWHGAGHFDTKVSVNVSAVQFRQPEFISHVKEALEASGINPRLLEIEITESVLIEEFEVAAHTLRRLDRMGVRAALDDFGTGYSSLAYLQRLPIGSLKIDRSFVSSLSMTPTGQVGSAVPIIEAIAAMGRNLGKIVVAEGVETEAQANYLARIGVDRAQGYLYSKPISATRATRLLGPSAPDEERAAARGAHRADAPILLRD